jgi:hypothetical protein
VARVLELGVIEELSESARRAREEAERKKHHRIPYKNTGLREWGQSPELADCSPPVSVILAYEAGLTLEVDWVQNASRSRKGRMVGRLILPDMQ